MSSLISFADINQDGVVDMNDLRDAISVGRAAGPYAARLFRYGKRVWEDYRRTEPPAKRRLTQRRTVGRRDYWVIS